MVKFVDLITQYESSDMLSVFKDIKDLLSTSSFVGGTALSNFEENAANYCGVKHAVGVGSGTDALILALKSAGIGEGDKVLVPANTFIATAMAVSHVGAEPVFIDVDPDTYVITSDTIRAGLLDDSVVAVIPVHLYGNAVDMDAVMQVADENNLKVIEDCAQAFGTFYNGKCVGTFGVAGCYSFYPAKNLGGLAQGGLVITNDDSLATDVRCFGNVGRANGSWFEYDRIGYNSRLDPINAVFLDNGLKYIDFWNKNRREIAALYNELLSDIVPIKVPVETVDAQHIYHLYELNCLNKTTRDLLKEFLTNLGIGTGLHYPVPCHKQPIYKGALQVTDLSVSESLADSLISLPMHPFLKESEVHEVCDAVIDFFK